MIEIHKTKPVKYQAIALRTKYWKPGEKYRSIILDVISNVISDGDTVVISEKAVSIAQNQIIDEGRTKPGITARFLSKIWMRVVWGNLLGKLCHMTHLTRKRLRNYPLEDGAIHKQVCLENVGFLQALRHGSEGGIDVTNLPYAYAVLPLKNAKNEANIIKQKIFEETGRNVSVIIADTDKSYKFGKKNYTPLPQAESKIIAGGGVFIYVLCRILRCKRRATPVGYAGEFRSVEELLDISETANRARGVGAGRTPWHMAERFGVGLTDVTWEMLERVVHYPVVVVKSFD